MEGVPEGLVPLPRLIGGGGGARVPSGLGPAILELVIVDQGVRTFSVSLSINITEVCRAGVRARRGAAGGAGDGVDRGA